MSKEKIESRFSKLLSSLDFKTQGDHDLMDADGNGFIDKGIYKATIVDDVTGLEYKLQAVIRHTRGLNADYSDSNDQLIVTNCKNNSSSSITFACTGNMDGLDNALRALREIVDGDVSYRMILDDNIMSISTKHRGHDRITASGLGERLIILYEILLNWCPSENIISSIDDIEDPYNTRRLLKSMLFRIHGLKMVSIVRSNLDCYMGMLQMDSIPFGMVFYLGCDDGFLNTNARYFMLCWPNTTGVKALMDDDSLAKTYDVSYYDSISSMLSPDGGRRPKSYVSDRSISLIEAMESYLKLRKQNRGTITTKINGGQLSVKGLDDNTSVIEFGSSTCGCEWRLDGDGKMPSSIVDIHTIIDFFYYYCKVYLSSKTLFDFICSKLREDGYDAEFNGNGKIILGDKKEPGLYIKADFTKTFRLSGLSLMQSYCNLQQLEEACEDRQEDGNIFSIHSSMGGFMIDDRYRLRMFIDMVEHEIDPTHRTPGIEAGD